MHVCSIDQLIDIICFKLLKDPNIGPAAFSWQDVISHVQLPMVTDEGVRFLSWPIVLPDRLAKQLLLNGYRSHLGCAEQHYWDMMANQFGVEKPLAADAIGLQLWGDEGQIFENEQMMAIQWSSEQSPWWKDARRSRFLICLLPVSKYVIRNKVNLTLQAVMKELVRALNWWRENPIDGLCAQVTNVKGDWKYIGQLLNLKRKPDTNSICFLCEGTKNLDVPITDLSPEAAWRRLVPKPPWDREPEILQLKHFNLALVGLDIMHIFYLGCGRDLVASVLVILLRMGKFAGSNAGSPCVITAAVCCFESGTC